MEFQPCFHCMHRAEIFEAPRFRMLIEKFGGYALNMWLGAYGAPTWKLVKLFSSDAFVYKLFRTARFFQHQSSCNRLNESNCFDLLFLHLPWRKLDKSKFKKSDSTIRYKDSSGRMRFKGSATLKQTQVYTPSFGAAEPQLHFMLFDWLLNTRPCASLKEPKEKPLGARTWGVQEVHHLCQCLTTTSPRNWLCRSMGRCTVSRPIWFHLCMMLMNKHLDPKWSSNITMGMNETDNNYTLIWTNCSSKTNTLMNNRLQHVEGIDHDISSYIVQNMRNPRLYDRGLSVGKSSPS